MVRDLLRRFSRRVLGRPAQHEESKHEASTVQRPLPSPTAPEVEEVAPEVEAEIVAQWREAGETLLFLDVREQHELRSGVIDGALLIPMNQVPHRLPEIPSGGRLIVYCAAGARSYGVANYLRSHGHQEAWSLIGGIRTWLHVGGALDVPPARARFPLSGEVRVTRDPLTVAGAEVPASKRGGTIQAIREDGQALRYTVTLLDKAGPPIVISDLLESELEPSGPPRG